MELDVPRHPSLRVAASASLRRSGSRRAEDGHTLTRRTDPYGMRTVGRDSRLTADPEPPGHLRRTAHPRSRSRTDDSTWHLLAPPDAQGGGRDADMHSIGEIHIRVTGRSEHNLVAPGLPTVGVGRGVQRPGVGLDLGQYHRHGAFGRVMLEHLPKQVRGDLGGRSAEKRPGEQWASSNTAGVRLWYLCAHWD